jgi:hypothetical protein
LFFLSTATEKIASKTDLANKKIEKGVSINSKKKKKTEAHAFA